MKEIVYNLPLFVWPLFAYLLIEGLKARKPSIKSIKILLLFPTAFSCWSIYSLISAYQSKMALLPWVLCSQIGFLMGFLHLWKKELRFDNARGTVELPGSYIPLILMMSIFFSKIAAGVLRAGFPDQFELIFALDTFSGLVISIFLGRAIACYRKSHLHSRV